MVNQGSPLGPSIVTGTEPKREFCGVARRDTMWIAGYPVAEIDRSALDAQTGGDSALAREVLLLFADECRRLLPDLTDPSLPAARRADIAHTLRGAAAGIGAGRIHQCAGTAETALRHTEAGADRAVAALAEAVAAAVAEIASGV